MKTRISLLFAVVLVGLFTLSTQVFAESGLPFEITPKFTVDQEPGVENYISIDVDGDSKDEVFEFTVKNIDTETKDVVVNVVDAYTSPNGVVQYTQEGSENSKIIDDSYKLTTHLELEGESIITLAGGEEKTIKAILDVDGVEGTLLGGLSFQLYGEEESLEQEGSSFKINNKVNMVIGVMINFNSDKEVDILVDKPFVDPMPSYYAVRVPVTMNAPILKKVNMKYDVLYEGEPIFDGKDDFDFAPMTKVNISLPWTAETIKNKKDYQIVGTLEYKDVDGETKQQDFDFTFNYSPESDIIKDITSSLKRPFVEGTFPWVLVLLVIVVGATIITFITSRKGLYVLVGDGEFPKEIHQDSDLYSHLEKKVDSIDEPEFGVYKKKRKDGESYYELDYIAVRDGDKNFKSDE